MSAANPLTEPERDIPLPELPATIRKMHENWALAYSRAEQLERELAKTRQAVDDWQSIALSNGEALAKAKVELERERLAADALRREIGEEKKAVYNALRRGDRYMLQNVELKKRLDLWIDEALEALDSDTLADIAEGPRGIECPDCGGVGRIETFDDVMVGGEHSTRDYTVDCDNCNATGRALR